MLLQLHARNRPIPVVQAMLAAVRFGEYDCGAQPVRAYLLALVERFRISLDLRLFLRGCRANLPPHIYLPLIAACARSAHAGAPGSSF